MEHFFHHNSYLTIFLSVVAGGEAGIFIGVALARAGSVTLAGVVAVSAAASFIGNMAYYYAGKFLWTRWGYLKKTFGAKVETSSRTVNRFGSPLMLVSRFFYGVRNVVPLALGMYNVNVVLFTLYNIIGAFVWAWVFVEAGWIVSKVV